MEDIDNRENDEQPLVEDRLLENRTLLIINNNIKLYLS